MATDIQNRLLDTARLRLPGALDAALYLEVFAVCEEFLRETSMWKELLPFTALPAADPYIVDPAQYTYALTYPPGSQPTFLMGIYDEDEIRHPGSMSVPGEIVLEIAPNEPTNYLAYVTMNVTHPVDVSSFPQMPAWIFERDWPALLDGLLFRMMSQPGKPYTSAQTAIFHGRRYSARKAQARVEALRNNLYGAQAWTFPQTFNRR